MNILVNILVKILRGLKAKSPANLKAKQDIQKLLAIPFEEVKRRALAMLSDRTRFRCVVARDPTSSVGENMGPVLRDFFSHFDSVVELNGEFSVGRLLIGDSSLRSGFLKIGSDFAFSELVIRPGEDQIYIVTDSEHELDGLPTIYHIIYLLE